MNRRWRQKWQATMIITKQIILHIREVFLIENPSDNFISGGDYD